MKLNWKRLSLVLAFILFLAFGFWYTQETTIQDHAPELDPALCQSITAWYFVNQKGDRDAGQGLLPFSGSQTHYP